MNVTSAFCQGPFHLNSAAYRAGCRIPYSAHGMSKNRRFLLARIRTARISVLMNAVDDSTGQKAPIESTDLQPQKNSTVQAMKEVEDFEAAPSKVNTKREYSLRTRLREEIEAPFRKARMFVYTGSAASAAVGAFISSLRIIAAFAGVSGVQPLTETVPNVAVDLGVIGLMVVLLRQESKAGERRMERMTRGARLSKLRLEDAATRQVVPLKDVRGSKRVVIVAGRADGVEEAMNEALPFREVLEDSSLRVVPLVTEAFENVTEEEILRQWRFKPFVKDEWLKWFSEERAIVGKRLENEGDVIVLVIRLDGKVGARSVGKPRWSRLVEEVQKLPPKDQYGKP